MSDWPIARWTVDCWIQGCGWSRTGFDQVELEEKRKQHWAEKHDKG